MRTTIIALFLITLPVAAASAGPVMTAGDAVADAKSDGYARIALTERTAQEWDVWASKDGIAYELKIDPRTGSLLQTIPLENDD